MPHVPDSIHADHDLELVAAYAAGDAEGGPLDDAIALVAACPDCAALHHDLRSIAAALPELPAPVRTRDYRLSADQAASLRPSGLRGLVATLSGPRFSFAVPLGTGLAALGIVGVLVSSGAIPFGSPGAGGAAFETQGGAAETHGGAAPVLVPAPGATGGDDTGLASAAPSGPGLELAVPVDDASPAASAPVDAGTSAAQPTGDRAVDGSGPPEAPKDLYGAALASPAPTSPQGATDAATLAPPSASPDTPLLAPGLMLVVMGLALVIVRWGARRLA